MASDVYDLSSKVVGIIDSEDDTAAAIRSLEAEGLTFDVLSGEKGRDRLVPDSGDGGVKAAFIEAFRTFGDQNRIVDRLESGLAGGSCVLAVAFQSEEEAEVAARILEEHQGHDLWRLGEWTQGRLGADDPD